MLRFTFYVSLICLMLSSTAAFAAFPDIGLGGRPMGMGGAFVALADDANSIFWNPAGLSQLQRAEFSSMRLNLYGLDVNSHLLSGTLRHPFAGGIGFGLLRTGETGLYMEDSLIVALGQDLQPVLNIPLSIGVSIKNLRKTFSNFDSNDSLFNRGGDVSQLSYDVGFLWRTTKLRIGGLAANIVPTNASLSSNDEVEIPPVFRAGVAFLPTRRITFAAEGVQRYRSGPFTQRSLRIGTELQPVKIQTGYISAAMVRGGVRFTEIQGSAAYLGGGLQLALGESLRAQLDYAFAQPITDLSSELGNTHRFSFSLAWLQPLAYPKDIAKWKRELHRNSEQEKLREKVTDAYNKWFAEDIRDSFKRTQVKDDRYAWQKLSDGWKLYAEDKYNDAIPPLKEAIERDSKLSEAHKILALSHWKLGQLSQAETEWDVVLDMEPEIRMPDQLIIDIVISKEKSKIENIYKANLERGTTAQARNNYQTAIQHWKVALLWSLSNGQTVRGQITNAYEKWLKLEGAFETPEEKKPVEAQQTAWKQLMSGLKDLNEQRYDSAISAFRGSLLRDSNLIEARKWIGSAHALKGNDKEAEAAFYQFLKQSPFLRFSLTSELRSELDTDTISARLQGEFQNNGIRLSGNVITPMKKGDGGWFIVDKENKQAYTIMAEADKLSVFPGFVPMDGVPETAHAIFDRLLATRVVPKPTPPKSQPKPKPVGEPGIADSKPVPPVVQPELSDEEKTHKEHVRQGLLALSREDYDTAIQHWQTALLWLPSDKITRNQISNAYTKWLDSEFEPPEQKQQIQNRQDAWKRLVRGYEHYLAQNYQSAIQMLDESVDLDGTLIEAYKWLGCAAVAADMPQKAEEALRQALQLQPDLILTSDVPQSAHQFFDRLKNE